MRHFISKMHSLFGFPKKEVKKYDGAAATTEK